MMNDAVTTVVSPVVRPELRCVVCNNEITKHLFPSRIKKNMLWCSSQCYRWKPPKIIWIEIKFGGEFRRPIEEILIETTRKFDTLAAQCDALDVSPPYLYTMVKRYFRMPLADFVHQYGTGSRLRRYRAKTTTVRPLPRITQSSRPLATV